MNFDKLLKMPRDLRRAFRVRYWAGIFSDAGGNAYKGLIITRFFRRFNTYPKGMKIKFVCGFNVLVIDEPDATQQRQRFRRRMEAKSQPSI